MFLVAFLAVYRSIARWYKRYFGFLTAVCASCFVHLSRTARSKSASSFTEAASSFITHMLISYREYLTFIYKDFGWWTDGSIRSLCLLLPICPPFPCLTLEQPFLSTAIDAVLTGRQVNRALHTAPLLRSLNYGISNFH
jgi:hypothetical protein